MTEQQATQPEFSIQRLYTKDVSFESPSSPQIFKEEWQPEVSMDLASKSNAISENIYDVTLHITVTVKKQGKTVFLVEVHQAGIFGIKGFQGEPLDQMLGSYCPNVLYPYARELVSSLAVRGGFPPLYLAPVNFDAFYAGQKQAREKEKTSA